MAPVDLQMLGESSAATDADRIRNFRFFITRTFMR